MNTLTQVRGEIFSKLNLIDETPSIAQRKMFLFQLFDLNLGFDFDFFEGQPYSKELFRSIEYCKFTRSDFSIELNEYVLQIIDGINQLSKMMGMSGKEFVLLYNIFKRTNEQKDFDKVVNFVKESIKAEMKLSESETTILEILEHYKKRNSKVSQN